MSRFRPSQPPAIAMTGIPSTTTVTGITGTTSATSISDITYEIFASNLGASMASPARTPATNSPIGSAINSPTLQSPASRSIIIPNIPLPHVSTYDFKTRGESEMMKHQHVQDTASRAHTDIVSSLRRMVAELEREDWMFRPMMRN
ncbi:hypothetical protein SeMB42_g06836 [Synchytrium endobioticum]|uniref:Uncharacterized protein n=1 Tax=Synchytrium endobioticum TaxID=286115 RepID=A0A507CES4_9FUNG|nr:hypothetical protein SeMB42_g06836 [Synchytrium endobioticum]TPX40520.1 hypothetical protein SeLEV6574_g06575 [Synchytrium endobioticum]